MTPDWLAQRPIPDHRIRSCPVHGEPVQCEPVLDTGTGQTHPQRGRGIYNNRNASSSTPAFSPFVVLEAISMMDSEESPNYSYDEESPL